MKTLLSSESVHEIVIFRALQLGDMLCSIPTLRAIRNHFSYARISLVGLPWGKEFVKRYESYCDDFIEFPGFPGLPEKTPDLLEFGRFLKRIQQRKFDLAIQLHGDGGITNFLVKQFGATCISGFYNPINGCPNPETFIPYPHTAHEIYKGIALLKFLKIPIKGDTIDFPISLKEKESAGKLIQQYNVHKKAYICIHPGARDIRRRWKSQYFADIADILRHIGFQIIFTGTKEETPLMKAIQKQMVYDSIDISGKTDLGMLGEIIKNAQLLICNDTGISHIASALRVKSIVIFSPFSKISQWAPLDTQLHLALGPTTNVDDVITNTLSIVRKNRMMKYL